MDPWHGKCPDKFNPLKRISNIVERYHLKKDEEAIRQTECVYKEMKTSSVKKYQLEENYQNWEGYTAQSIEEFSYTYSWILKNMRGAVKTVARKWKT